MEVRISSEDDCSSGSPIKILSKLDFFTKIARFSYIFPIFFTYLLNGTSLANTFHVTFRSSSILIRHPGG